MNAWAVQYLRSQLDGVNVYDPLVWTAASATLVLVALAGGIIPAARVDPSEVLRIG